MVSYKSRPNAKDFIQVEVVVEKNSQKIILIGKVNYVLHILSWCKRVMYAHSRKKLSVLFFI